MEEERDQLQEKLDALEAEQERMVDEAMEIADTDDPDEQARFNELTGQNNQMEALVAATRGYLEVVERAIDEWGGTEITIRELSGAETRALQARAHKRAESRGLDGYSDTFHETLMLEKSVESTPVDCPDPENIGDLPDRLFDWLVNRANALNSTGDFDMGNSSLREKIAERRNQQP